MIRIALAGIAEGGSLGSVTRLLWPLDDKVFPFPADVLTELGADALDLAGATRAAPVSFVEVRERYLPEWEFRGNTEHQKSRVAIQAVVMTSAGLTPDYYADAGWWRVQDLALFSFYALVIMVRIAAVRTGRSVADVCGQIAAARGVSI
ncbi:MAG TPA: hypothetical protein VGQ20_13890 [Acidimicrobiales bacterium]|nr:hypothetical protein [Acidimicrobiales bacterium]